MLWSGGAENLRLKLENAERELQGAEASKREKQIAMLRHGRASCEEFFEEWGMKASPPSISALFGITREATAAPLATALGLRSI
jgi:hypothetical protein